MREEGVVEVQVETILNHVERASSHKIVGCRHMPHFERQPEVLDVVSRFVEKQAA